MMRLRRLGLIVAAILCLVSARAEAQKEVYANNCSTTLASGINAAVTSLTVAAGDGAKCPVTGSDYFWGTLQSGTTIEIVNVTARATDVFTIVRAQQGTAAASFSTGAIFEQRVTASTLSTLQAAAAATVITETASTELTGELALGSLGTGLLKNTTTTGVPSIYAGTSCTNQFPRSLDASGAATCASVALGADVSGQVPIANGGTGLSSLTQGDLLYFNSGTTLTALAKNTSASRYLSNGGTSNNPSWAQIDLTNGVTGILPTANGGTANGFFTVSGPATSAKTFTFPDASATVLTSNALVTSAQGGTGNGFTKFSGPASSEKTFTLPNASATILTDNALVTAAQGGTANGFFAVSGPASSTKTYTFPNASAAVLTDNALVTAAQGGTANGFFAVSGPATSTKTFTFPDSSATVITSVAAQVLNKPTIGISGTSASAQINSVGSAPTCAFSTGGGSSPSCALETGSTDLAGTMTITTGSGSPGSTGTITLTLNASYGTNNPVCIAGLADGATAWSVNSTVRVSTISKTAPVFTWLSATATALVTLTASTNYKISYICVGK